jgi:hypothetical protein
LAAWRVKNPDREAVLLSTCHRVELYAATADPQANIDPPALIQYLANFHNVPAEEIGSELLSEPVYSADQTSTPPSMLFLHLDGRRRPWNSLPLADASSLIWRR